MLYRIMRSLEQVLRQLLLLKLLVGPSIDDKFFNSFKVIVLVGVPLTFSLRDILSSDNPN